MKLLEELWYGNVKPTEKRLPSNSEQYELVNLIARHEETILPMMSEQARKTYEKLQECKSELSSLVECEAFVTGFQIGAKIMLEVMESDDYE